MNKIDQKLGTTIAYSVAVLTFITFVIAFLTPPISGPFCQGDCIEYPYLDVLSRFPRDYYWMYLAIIISLLYVAFMVSIYFYAPETKKIYGILGIAFAILSSTLLVGNYFIQVSVIQPSQLKGEIDGIPILTQYNPHGLFIALEEAGYLVMCVSFFCVFPVFSWKHKPERILRLLFIAGLPAALLALLLVTLKNGVIREYSFEIIIISITWLILIISGLLLGRSFSKSDTENI